MMGFGEMLKVSTLPSSGPLRQFIAAHTQSILKFDKMPS
jgi:hypothetical protein